MLSQIVGQVDYNSAAVLIFAFITMCIVITAMVIKRRSRVDVHNDFELAKLKLKNEDEQNKRQNDRMREYELGKLASEREVEFKRIDTNMITSHSRTSDD